MFPWTMIAWSREKILAFGSSRILESTFVLDWHNLENESQKVNGTSSRAEQDEEFQYYLEAHFNCGKLMKDTYFKDQRLYHKQNEREVLTVEFRTAISNSQQSKKNWKTISLFSLFLGVRLIHRDSQSLLVVVELIHVARASVDGKYHTHGDMNRYAIFWEVFSWRARPFVEQGFFCMDWSPGQLCIRCHYSETAMLEVLECVAVATHTRLWRRGI